MHMTGIWNIFWLYFLKFKEHVLLYNYKSIESFRLFVIAILSDIFFREINYRKASISARPCIVPEPRIVPEFY